MADDHKFSLGDILWEYADYTPPEEPGQQPPSAPAPVQPVISAPRPVRPAGPESVTPQRTAPPKATGETLPANAPVGTPRQAPTPLPQQTAPVPQAAASPTAIQAPAPPKQDSTAATQAPETPKQEAPPQAPAQNTGVPPPDDGPDLIVFTPDPKAKPEAPAAEVQAGENAQAARQQTAQMAQPTGQTAQQTAQKPPRQAVFPPKKQQAASTQQAAPVQQAASTQQAAPVQQAASAQQAAPAPAQQAAPAPAQQQVTGSGGASAEAAGIHLKTERKKRTAPEPPPDVPPAQLAQHFTQGLATAIARSAVSAVLTVVLLLFALMESGQVPFLGGLLPDSILFPASLGLFVLVCLLCQEVLKNGLVQMTNSTPDADSLALFAALFTIVDGVTLLLSHLRTETLPFFAPCALVLTFHLIGHTCGKSARQNACAVAAATSKPYVVTQDKNVIGPQTAFRKWLSAPQGFGSQILTPSHPDLHFRRLTPVLMVACFVLSLITTVAHHQPKLIFWSLSALFTAAATLGAGLALEMPFRLVTGRLKKLGAALAGWPGIAGTKGGRSVLLGDYDLYPPGAVTLADAQPLNGKTLQEAVGWAASAIRASGSGLVYLFEQLRQRARVNYTAVSQVELRPNGLIAKCADGKTKIFVGNSEFMSLNGVALPVGVKATKDAMFCAVNLTPVGVFTLKYDLHPVVLPCLQSLFSQKIYPIFATRDYHLTPQRLRAGSQLPGLEDFFPDLGRRLNLSSGTQPHSYPLIAVLTREGLLSYSQALVAAKRVRRAAGWNSVFVRVGACVGVFLTATLSSAGAFGAMCAWNLSLFLLLWLVPVLLLSLWARLT